jgi:hypothetical protein
VLNVPYVVKGFSDKRFPPKSNVLNVPYVV